MLEIAVFAPFLQDYAKWVEERVSVPSRVRVSRSFREDDVLPFIPEAEIVLTSHWSKRLGAAARNLRFIQMPGAGWDKIDPEGIPPGVLVANSYEHERGIAEWVVMMCLALARDLLPGDRYLRMGVWRYFPAIGQRDFYTELGGQTVGIIGLGRIGREVARLTAPFDMRRIGIDAFPVSDAVQRELGLEYVGGTDDLDRVLAESDFVVISMPYNDDTRGLFNAERLRQMKRTAFLLNPARAEICDERDLYEALRDRVIAGAALDPWWHYPKIDEVVAPSKYPYQELANVIMTPHISGSTSGMLKRRMHVVVDNINRYLRGEPVINVVRDLSRAEGATVARR